MGPTDSTATAVAAILHAAFMVRHYDRPSLSAMDRQRAQAVRAMGLAARAAFLATEDFEPLLYAIADGLFPFDSRVHDARRR